MVHTLAVVPSASSRLQSRLSSTVSTILGLHSLQPTILLMALIVARAPGFSNIRREVQDRQRDLAPMVGY